jgi:hypothetical protein
VRCTATGRDCSVLLQSGGWMHAEVGPWIQVLPSTPFGSNRHNHSESSPSKVCCGSRDRQDAGRGRVQGRPHQQGRPHLLVWPHVPGVVRWLPFYPICVYASKNTNTTRGTLLVLKICMKIVIYPPRPRFWRSETCCKDRQQTPPCWTFACPRAKSSLGLGRTRVASMLLLCKFLCTIPYSTCCWKGRSWETLSHALPVWLVTFHLAFGGWRVERFGLCITHFSLFWILSRSFEIFTKRGKVPRMVLSIARVVLVSSPKALSEPQLPTSMACMWSFG